jgi:hypothetical protein
MSQPRRRRRRGRRRQSGGDATRSTRAPNAAESGQAAADPQRSGRARRRRRRRPAPDRQPEAPQTLEDVVREAAHRPTEGTTAPDDGRKLEDVIGELQSIWGVPQYPQEFRITVKVADERSDARPTDEPAVTEIGPNGVKRERAPAAPRVAPSSGAERGVPREQAPRRRRRTRRGRRRGGGREGWICATFGALSTPCVLESPNVRARGGENRSVSIELRGPVAHLVERRHGMAEVVGSIPIGSTFPSNLTPVEI